MVKSLEGERPENRSPSHSEIFFLAQKVLGKDLFGEPIIERRERRGRPAHIRTIEKANRVLLGLVRGLSAEDIALSIECSVPTLYKHYSKEMDRRKSARLRMEMRQLERLNAEAENGNVAAEKALADRLDKLRVRDQQKEQAPAPSKTPKPAGKKEMLRQAAMEQRGLYEPPPPPVVKLN